MLSWSLCFCGGPNGDGLLSQACVISSRADVCIVRGIVEETGTRRGKSNQIAVGKCQALPNIEFLRLSLRGLSGVGSVYTCLGIP